MEESADRYLNPFTDFGFKKLFGEEPNIFFEVAEIARFSQAELLSYEDSLKYYRDLKNSLDTAREEGREEGRLEGREQGRLEGEMAGALREKLDIIQRGREAGLSMEMLANLTGLTPVQINELLNH